MEQSNPGNVSMDVGGGNLKGLTSAEAEAALIRHGRNVSQTMVCQKISCFCFPHGGFFLPDFEKSALFKREADYDEWKGHETTAGLGFGHWPGYKAPTYRVLRDETWKDVPTELIVPDDIIELRKDDQVPADGKLVALPEGESLTVNQCHLTGENYAVPFLMGQDVVMYEGSRVVTAPTSGALLRITATGAKTHVNITRIMLVPAAAARSVSTKWMQSNDPIVIRLVDEFQRQPYPNRA